MIHDVLSGKLSVDGKFSEEEKEFSFVTKDYKRFDGKTLIDQKFDVY